MRSSHVGGAILLASGTLLVAWQLLDRGIVRVNYPDPARYPVRGIDVSHHQGSIDWQRVAAAGTDFAWIKSSEGETFRDPRFTANWQDARAAGIATGAYHFYSLCKPALAQAANFLAAAPPPAALVGASTPPALPPAVDLEFGGNCGQRPSAEALWSEVHAFATAVEAAWQRPLVLYVTREFHDEYVHSSGQARPLWARSVFGPPHWAGFDRWAFWQYGNRGHLDGIAGFVDLNVYAGSRAEFAALLAELHPVPARGGPSP